MRVIIDKGLLWLDATIHKETLGIKAIFVLFERLLDKKNTNKKNTINHDNN